MTLSIQQLIAKELTIPLSQVTATVTLLDDGNTIPFIARYRKEVTGGLDEVQIRDIQERLEYLRKLAERRDAVKAEIASQEKLTDELAAQLDAAATLQAVEDLYRPYKPKRQTRAAMARERGLEPLAQAILAQATGRGGRGEVISPLQMAAPFVTEQVPDVEAALAGARDIIAEQASDDAATRNRCAGVSPPTASLSANAPATRLTRKAGIASTTTSAARCAPSSRTNGWRSNAAARTAA